MKILSQPLKVLKFSLLVLIILGAITFGLVYANVIKFPGKVTDCSKVPKAENAVVIKMENHKFDPDNLTAKVCDTLLFLNLGDESRWPVGDGFDAGHEMAKFDFYQFQVTRTGTYSFHDHPHQDIIGKITINK